MTMVSAAGGNIRRTAHLALLLGSSLVLAETGLADTGQEWVFIGTRGTGGPPAPLPGAISAPEPEQGIYAARLDVATGHLTAVGMVEKLEHATWLLSDPTRPVLYSVGSDSPASKETDIYGFAIDPASGKLQELDHVPSGGSDATHLGIDTRGHFLFAANHASGNVTMFPLRKDGGLEGFTSSQRDDAVGSEARQKVPAAHAVVVDPTRKYLLVNYFSGDRVAMYRIDEKARTLTPASPPFQDLAPGSGPRHLVFDPSGHHVYINGEINGTIQSFSWDGTHGHLRPLEMVSAYSSDYPGRRSAAELAITPDGRYLYMSLRGDQNSIVAYAIDPASGKLQEIQRVSSQGKLPWSLGIDPSGHWLLVANAGSNVVSVLEIETATGMLSPTAESWSIPAGPVALAFYPAEFGKPSGAKK